MSAGFESLPLEPDPARSARAYGKIFTFLLRFSSEVVRSKKIRGGARSTAERGAIIVVVSDNR